ncbi:fasciclin domain-containing protein [Sphingomonas sp. SUN019]|uniref:fasciclin domain-containing protein n=1 Tax=Sphingomonas sp. SUN019 TaxID=2937788 RepID=UPI00216462BB|nr:fasciclin domain-containing protein [Sphingomonas sp. SUN019]UVO52084.1 fasciclin domain-containing protein [Sphingomonas sp. SUN019]
MTKLPLIALVGALAMAGCAPMNADTATASDPAPAAATAAPADTAMAPAGNNPMVGGAAMVATKTIVENASAAPNLTTLVAALKAAGLVETLSGPGPFTVFAPTNDAFARLAPGTVDTLLKPENKASLVKVLTYHVVPGNVGSEQLKTMITTGGGTATLTTVEGSTLTARMEGAAISVTDVNGTKSYIETPDVRQSNGVVHVVNGVVVPKLG